MLSVALFNIRSLYNVGSVFRTASGAGFEHIFLSGYTGTPPHSRLSKVALGTENEVPFTHCPELEDLLTAIDGHHVVALERHSSAKLYNEVELPVDRSITVLLGEEIFGIPAPLMERADQIAEIPMAGEKESLNVACAFAVIAYDFSLRLGRVGEQHQLKNQPSPIAVNS